MHRRRIQVLRCSQKDALQHLKPIVIPQQCIDPRRKLLVSNLALSRVDLHDANKTFERDAKRLERTR